MANLIVNADAGTTFYGTNGDVIAYTGTSSTPKVIGGAAAGIGGNSASSAIDYIKSAKPTTLKGGATPYRGLVNGVASWATGAFYCSVSTSGGYLGFKTTEATTHNWAVGSLVSVRPSGAVAPQASGNYVFGVHTIRTAGTNGFDTSYKYDASANGVKCVVSRLVQDTATTFAQNNQVIAARITTKLYGGASSAFKTAGNVSKRGSIHQVVSVRTTKTTSAYRAGSYNRLTGKWLSAPSLANDYSTGTMLWATGATNKSGASVLDTAANPLPYAATSIPGLITFKMGDGQGKDVVRTTYKAKTN